MNTKSPATVDGLSVEDRHLQTRAVLALGTRGESSWRITLATDALSCSALLDAYPDRPPTAPGTRVDFWVRRAMTPGGKLEPWSIRSTFITDEGGGRGMMTRGAMLEAVAESAANVRVVGVDLAATDGGRRVAVTGALLAKNCGRVTLLDDAMPQPDLSVSLMGNAYPVRGATIRAIGKRFHLRLSRAPHRCGSVFTEGFDSYIDLALDDTDPPTLVFASLQGDAFPDSPSGSKGKETFVVETAKPLSGTTTTEVKLSGKLDLTGYTLAVEGKVNALRCQTKEQASKGSASPTQGSASPAQASAAASAATPPHADASPTGQARPVPPRPQ